MRRPVRIPYWPRRMQAHLAAAYCGISLSKFLKDVGAKYSQPHKDGHNSLWYREDLDEALDSLKGEVTPSDPFMEALNGDHSN